MIHGLAALAANRISEMLVVPGNHVQTLQQDVFRAARQLLLMLADVQEPYIAAKGIPKKHNAPAYSCTALMLPVGAMCIAAGGITLVRPGALLTLLLAGPCLGV